MNDSLGKMLNKVKISNYIYIIFIVISLIGFYANKNQKDYIFNNNKKSLKKAHNARMVILVIALLIYIYYLEIKVVGKRKNASREKAFIDNLNILAAILFLIGGIIAIYLEYKGNEEIIITE